MTQAANLASLGSNASSTGTLGASSYASSTIPNSALSGNPTFRNRIINGGMNICQRTTSAVNNGSAGSGLGYKSVDMFGYWANSPNIFTMQQSSTAPTGFSNSLLITSLASTPTIPTTYYTISQRIEGFNCADLAWGTSSAATVTFSFWIRCSLTGTFSGYVMNNGYSYQYPFTFTISAANTWEQKSITIPGPTAGTWLGGNSNGIEVGISLGVSTSYSDTANVWTSKSYVIGVDGTVNLVATNGATMYTTGWQFEKGSTASSFEYRSIGTELQLCQRYLEKSYNIGTAPGTNSPYGLHRNTGSSDNANNLLTTYPFKVTKRATPTMTYYTESGTSGSWSYSRSGASGTNTMNDWNLSDTRWGGYLSVGASYTSCYSEGHWVASAEL